MNHPASKANSITFFPVPSAFPLHKSHDMDALASALFVCQFPCTVEGVRVGCKTLHVHVTNCLINDSLCYICRCL